ncbi:MAG: RdgB/HAM1 family non-canonical purine NTP pyrophosphatase [Candidatus Goldbacteria bacterium]|nr:RdgB/HAM1 family non-canonical purine NTP pyrophosphatase [Candidatus Goldiibacteriota bacterium]
MTEIILASNNKNKALEIAHIFKGKKVRVLTLDEIGFKGDIKETGETLAQNAAIKARAVRKMAKGRIIIADDSGLEVEYLAKAPGVYSARFAGPGCTYNDNNLKLLKLMHGVKKAQRKASFRTVICIVFPDGREAFAEGRVNGYISETVTGKQGFGYDPVFFYAPMKRTFAEMTFSQKNMVSHRRKASVKAWEIIKKELKKKTV